MDVRAVSQIRSILDKYGPSIACWVFVAAVLAGAAIDREPPLAIYLVSFLYYGLYWHALAWGIRSFRLFKRDAILLKVLSVAALSFAYLQAPLDLLSIAVIASGILLNARAASVLGIDRTYYGRELAGLEPRRLTAFPYSLLDHPMIVGNVLAFGGTLINPAFRADWWPLATLHVLLNLALLAMELAAPTRRPAVRLAGIAVASATAVAAMLAGLGPQTTVRAPHELLAALLATAAVAVVALVLALVGRRATPAGAGNDNDTGNLSQETT